MKTPLLISGVLSLFVCCCEPLSLNYKNGICRISHHSPRTLSHTRDSSNAAAAGEIYYYTTVSFPPDYDWRRDTSYGAVQASINLYRNDSLMLQIPTGAIACPDADMHHFIQEHLYTQFRTGGRTILARDGETILELDHEAFLAGILPLEGKLYTLWSRHGGEGFSLLVGDIELFSRSKGQPLGSPGLGSYAPCGALYPDQGSPCFCYRDGNDWYVVREAQEASIRKPYWTVFDIRSIDGQMCIFYRGDTSISSNLQYKETVTKYSVSQYKYLNSGYIYSGDGEPFCAGTAYEGWDTENPHTIVGFLSGQTLVLPGSGISRMSSNPLALLFYSPDGTTGYYFQETGIKYLEGKYYHLSPHAGIRMDGHLYIALNPMEHGRKPCIWKDGEIQELDLNGYISGIYQSSQ